MPNRKPSDVVCYPCCLDAVRHDGLSCRSHTLSRLDVDAPRSTAVAVVNNKGACAVEMSRSRCRVRLPSLLSARRRTSEWSSQRPSTAVKVRRLFIPQKICLRLASFQCRYAVEVHASPAPSIEEISCHQADDENVEPEDASDELQILVI